MRIRGLGVVLLSLALVGCAYEAESEAVGQQQEEDVVHIIEQLHDEHSLTQFDDVDSTNHQIFKMGEREACDTIFFTYRDHGLDIGCPTTLKICPDMLREPFGQACLQYDRRTVLRCAQRIVNSNDCEQLRETSCAVMPIIDSAPYGCEQEIH
jgi:hypothetical protein